MKRLIFCLVIVTVCLIHLTSSSVLSAHERRIALVIGNGAYKSVDLKNDRVFSKKGSGQSTAHLCCGFNARIKEQKQEVYLYLHLLNEVPI